MKTIDIPIQACDDFIGSIYKLIKIISTTSDLEQAYQLFFDFSKSKMLNPLFLGGLSSHLSWLFQNETIPSLTHNADKSSLASYLSTIAFPSGLVPEINFELFQQRM